MGDHITVGIRDNDPDSPVQHVGDFTVVFRDSTRRWIDVRHFELPSGTSLEDGIKGLMGHLEYRDTYLGGRPSQKNTVHGRYRLDAIEITNYVPTSASDALEWLDDFCGLFNTPPADVVRRDIDAAIKPRLKECHLLRLDCPDEAQHEMAWILREFRELVLFDGQRSTLSLLVMGID